MIAPYKVKEWWCCIDPIVRELIANIAATAILQFGLCPSALWRAYWQSAAAIWPPNEEQRWIDALGITFEVIEVNEVPIEFIRVNLVSWAYIILWQSEDERFCLCGCCERKYPSTCTTCLRAARSFPFDQ